MTGLIALILAALLALPVAAAERLRVATYDAGLTRDGAGVLLHELTEEPGEALAAALTVIRAARADMLLLTGIDHDLRGRALTALAGRLRQGPDGIDYPHLFHTSVNAGEPSGHDLDADGRLMGWSDAFGWGKFPGHGGMAILSRLPLDTEAARTFRLFPWSGLPGALLPERPDGTPFPDPDARTALRLSSRAHWDVPVVLADGTRLHLLASNPTPPLFDGEEGFNRRRNHDEIRFWSEYLSGTAFRDDEGREAPAPAGPLVVLGNLNTDPADGAGLRDGIADLIAHPRLRDPAPASPGAAAAARDGANARHGGPPELDTADFRDDGGGPGNLRIDYVLPSRELRVVAAGVLWPAPGDPLADAARAASSHRLVRVDLELRAPNPIHVGREPRMACR